jgi:Tfp pilus assembly protein PilN
MSVRVNLLPEATRIRDRAARQRTAAGAGFLALLLVLGGVWLLQDRQFDRLETELAAEHEELSRLRAEEAQLAAYAELATLVSTADDRVTQAMSAEVSLAGVLQDLAAVTPADTGLTSLTVTIPQRVEGELAAGPAAPIGTMALSGHSLTGHAPGLERILLELDKVGYFDEPFFNSSTLDEDGVATFTLDVGLLPSSQTGRYDEGVPEVLR